MDTNFPPKTLILPMVVDQSPSNTLFLGLTPLTTPNGSLITSHNFYTAMPQIPICYNGPPHIPSKIALSQLGISSILDHHRIHNSSANQTYHHHKWQFDAHNRFFFFTTLPVSIARLCYI